MKPMNSTECYVERFFRVSKNESLIDDENAAIQYIFTFSNNLVQIIIQLSAPSLDSFVQSGRAIDNSDIISITNSVIDNLLNNAKQYETITEIKEEEFHSLYDDVIKQAMELEFKIPEVLENTFEKFTDLVFLLLNRSNDILSSSGLVIAGYGTDDSFHHCIAMSFKEKF